MNQAEFDALYTAQWSSLVAQVTMVCGDRTEAADCVQEAFVRAWEHRRELDADAGGWVRTAALRVAVSRWRRTRNAMTAWTREQRYRDRAEDAVRPRHEADAPVWQALAALPAAQREALVMHHVLDMPLAQVAAVAAVPLGTVKARLSRGRAALAVALSGDPADVPAKGLRASAPVPDGLRAVPTRAEGAR